MTVRPLWTNDDIALFEDDDGVKLEVHNGPVSSDPISAKDRWNLAQALMATLPDPEED